MAPVTPNSNTTPNPNTTLCEFGLVSEFGTPNSDTNLREDPGARIWIADGREKWDCSWKSKEEEYTLRKEEEERV